MVRLLRSESLRRRGGAMTAVCMILVLIPALCSAAIPALQAKGSGHAGGGHGDADHAVSMRETHRTSIDNGDEGCPLHVCCELLAKIATRQDRLEMPVGEVQVSVADTTLEPARARVPRLSFEIAKPLGFIAGDTPQRR